MLGRDVLRAAEHASVAAVGYPRAELDLLDAPRVAEVLAADRPDAVVNCAAWTDVDGAETEEGRARAGNAEGPEILARACAQANARLVHVSTDYVFAGDATRPYVESDPVGPIGAYGRTKLDGERRVTAALPSAVIARGSWLFGTGGKNFV